MARIPLETNPAMKEKSHPDKSACKLFVFCHGIFSVLKPKDPAMVDSRRPVMLLKSVEAQNFAPRYAERSKGYI